MLRSGLTHIRFDHNHWPTSVDLKCPKCQSGKATAFLETHQGIRISQRLFTELDWQSSDLAWCIICTSCTYRRIVLLELPSPFTGLSEFYYKLDVYGFFAYNKDHLNDLASFFASGNTNGLVYQFLIDSYCHGNWKRHRDRLLKKIRQQGWLDFKTE